MTEDSDPAGDSAEVADPTGNGDRPTADGETKSPGSASGDSDAVADGDAAPAQIGLAEARTRALDEAEAVLTDPIEDVIEVRADGDDWLVTVEVLERSAVPDTQDILARYELTLDAGGTLTGYGLVERYKRADLRGNL